MAAVLLAAAGSAAWALDDVDETNNVAVDATNAGTLGFVRTGRVLAVGDEDWYRFRVPAARDSVAVEVAYDTALYLAEVGLEIQTPAGDVIASGGLVDVGGPVRAVTGALPAGDYLARVRHVSGVEVGAYALRSYGANDSAEPNDVSAAATPVGVLGFVRTGRVLNFGDQDWYGFTVAAATSGPVTVDVSFDSAAYASSLTVEVQTAQGAVLATGSRVGTSGPYRAVTSPLAAGDYLVRVRHDSGAAVSDYAVQAYEALAVTLPSYVETTVGKLVDEAIDVKGGVKPYTLVVFNPATAPPGIAFDALNGKMTGVAAPTGRFDFMVTCRDSGSPANTVSQFVTIVVNAKLEVQLGEFTAFPLGRPTSRAIPFTGGTIPFATTMGAALPAGISVPTGQLSFHGTAQQAGSAPMSMTVIDGAGLADLVDTTAVVCRPLGAFDMADGHAACGVWFDVVKDGVATLKVSTARKQSKRALRAVLLGPDGTTPMTANLKAGKGTASLTKFVAPATGRYYLVVASETGVATSLVASGKIAPPTAGSRRRAAFDAQGRAEISVGALAGAKFTFSTKSDKSGVGLEIAGIVDPQGVQRPFAPGELTIKAGKVSIAKTLDASGTWTLVVVEHGGPSTMSWSYKLRQPKGVSYSADD